MCCTSFLCPLVGFWDDYTTTKVANRFRVFLYPLSVRSVWFSIFLAYKNSSTVTYNFIFQPSKTGQYVTIQKCPYVTAKQRFCALPPYNKSRLSCLAAQKAAFYRLISGAKSLAEAYSGRSSSFSRLCQTFCTSSFSSRASSSLPMAFSWSGSVRRVVVMGTMARSSDRIS